MSARAVWKGVVTFADVEVPVKLYTAIENRDISFRLLERESSLPVRQALVDPGSGEVVQQDEAERGFVTAEGELVAFDEQELEELEPESSRVIEICRFVPPGEIEYRWYLRPYYLGPDGDEEAYFALTAALGRQGLEGVAQWVMRDKEYVGALRLHRGYPLLITLRYAEDVLPLEELSTEAAGDLDNKQLRMAAQLIDLLGADFEMESYTDDYRERVLDSVERKRSGDTVSAKKTRKPRRTSDLSAALEKSLAGSAAAEKNGRGKRAAKGKGAQARG